MIFITMNKIKYLLLLLLTTFIYAESDGYAKNGDIEIKITGIRPGEKIKEELTINGYTEKIQL